MPIPSDLILGNEPEWWQCPRCRLQGKGDWLDYIELAKDRTLGCAYCEENARRLPTTQRLLPGPTKEYPTATGLGME